MARVTVQDCIEIVSNRFDLVLYASQRSRGITAGNPITIDRDNDKNPVVSLREIAKKTIDKDILKDEIIKGLQKLNKVEIPEEDIEEENVGDENIKIELESFKLLQNEESNTEISGFKDVDAEVIKSEDI